MAASNSRNLLPLLVLAAILLDLSLASAHRHHRHHQHHPHLPHGPHGSAACRPSGHLRGKSGKCNRIHDSDCCEDGKSYPRFSCSPPVVARGTHAHLTVNSFAKGRDGGGPAECDGKYHSDSEMVLALSTGWYHGGSRCGKFVIVHANGRSVKAKVVDECDSLNGCDDEHDFQPPCDNDIVDASPAVWKALGIPESVGYISITWNDAD